MGSTPILTRDGTTKAATVMYTAVVVNPIPRMRAAIMVSTRATQSLPAAISIMRLVNLSPNPETKTHPIMMPAQAQATETGTDLMAPSSRALRSPMGDIRVSGLRKLNIKTARMARNAAYMGV